MSNYASRRLINTLTLALLLLIGFAIASAWLRNVPVSTCEVQTLFERQQTQNSPTAVFNFIDELWTHYMGTDLFIGRVLSIFFIVISCAFMVLWSKRNQVSILTALPLVVFGISTAYWGWSTPHAFLGLLMILVVYSFCHVLDRLESRSVPLILGGFGLILSLIASIILWSNKMRFSTQTGDYWRQITQLPTSIVLLWVTVLIGVSICWWEFRRNPKKNQQQLLILMWLCIPICMSVIFSYWTSLLVAIIIPAIVVGLIIILNVFDARVRLVVMLLMMAFALSRFPSIYYSYALSVSQPGFSTEFRGKYIPNTLAVFMLDKTDMCSIQGDLIAQVAPTVTTLPSYVVDIASDQWVSISDNNITQLDSRPSRLSEDTGGWLIFNQKTLASTLTVKDKIWAQKQNLELVTSYTDQIFQANFYHVRPPGEIIYYFGSFSLLGFDLGPDYTIPAGTALTINSWWTSSQIVADDYLLNVSLVNSSGQPQVSQETLLAQSQTRDWQSQTLHYDRHILNVPPTLESGTYNLIFTIHGTYGDLTNLSATSIDGRTVGQVAYITTITITP